MFEHIRPADSHAYAQNVAASLSPHGTFICGCPSLESQDYGCEESKGGHVNCLSGKELKKFFFALFF